jgi:hypothetical protein
MSEILTVGRTSNSAEDEQEANLHNECPSGTTSRLDLPRRH